MLYFAISHPRVDPVRIRGKEMEKMCSIWLDAFIFFSQISLFRAHENRATDYLLTQKQKKHTQRNMHTRTYKTTEIKNVVNVCEYNRLSFWCIHVHISSNVIPHTRDWHDKIQSKQIVSIAIFHSLWIQTAAFRLQLNRFWEMFAFLNLITYLFFSPSKLKWWC